MLGGFGYTISVQEAKPTRPGPGPKVILCAGILRVNDYWLTSDLRGAGYCQIRLPTAFQPAQVSKLSCSDCITWNALIFEVEGYLKSKPKSLL